MNRVAVFGIGIGLLGVASCSGQSCSCLAPLPFGFPANERIPNATQVRVSQSGIAAFEADPTVVASMLFGDALAFQVAASCPDVCCPGGTPAASCGPIQFDVTEQPGDLPRVELTPVQGASRVDLRLRARVVTAADIPIDILGASCGLHIDTTEGTDPDVQIDIPLNFTQDATAGTTRVVVGSLSLSNLSDDDISISGNFVCVSAGLGIGSFLNVLQDTFANAIQQSFATSLCKACPSGDVAECGQFADACTDGICMRSAECLQELGVLGRLSSGALFAGAPPGSTGTLDLYEVAGGYATTNTGGIALGVLGGMIPSGAARDRCGPAATPPPLSTIPQSAYFQGNTRPDTGEAFDVAIGLHESELRQFSYAAYEGGVLCPTVGTAEVAALTSNLLAADIPSLSNLTGGDQPIAVGLRPQEPPTFVLGANTFDGGGAVTEPLLDLTFDGMEIDLFANVEDQPIRLLTFVADVHVPVGVEIDSAGNLVPVLGSAEALNVTTTANEPLQELGAELTAVAPMLLELVLPELVNRLGPLPFPTVGGMDLHFTAATAVDSNAFLGLFAELEPSSAPKIGTRNEEPSASGVVSLGSVTPPGPPHSGTGTRSVVSNHLLPLTLLASFGLVLLYAARRRAPRWAIPATLVGAAVITPAACGGDGESDHDAPDSGTSDGSSTGGDGGDGGQATGGSSGSGTGGQVGSGGAPGTGGDGDGGNETDGGGLDGGGTDGGNDAGTDPCGAAACLPGEAQAGELGQWNSVDTGARRVIASYDPVLGDVVLVELSGGVETRRVVDGVPDVTPTHDPSGYRGGIVEPGPDVGAWTSVRLAGARAVVAYQDRDRGALRVAFEDASGEFHAHDVDDSAAAGVEIGRYASLAIGSTPAIAYLATGVSGGGGTITELRLATAATSTPNDSGDWTTSVVASAPESAALDHPEGTGLFVDLLALADGRRVLVHYDRARKALVASVESTAGSTTFNETILDGGGALDRGRWASAVLDAAGLVHVAYEDAIGHQVFYLTFTPGGAVSAPEVVDDGTRAGDRPHWVGAGIALWIDAVPCIAYQDAASANVVIALRNGSWSNFNASTGAELDGFHVAAPEVGAGPLVWDRMDSATAASHRLVIVENP